MQDRHIEFDPAIAVKNQITAKAFDAHERIRNPKSARCSNAGILRKN